MNQRILLIEDEEVILKALRRLLERNRYEVVTAKDIHSAQACQPHDFDLILADLRLPGAPGTDIIPLAEPVPVIIMTSHASVRSAVAAMRAGAIDYIAKPFDHNELLLLIERSLMQNRLQTQNRALRADLERTMPALRYIMNTALEPLMNEALDLLKTQRLIHLQGELGSGRELIARGIHRKAQEVDAPLIVIDCVPEASDKNTPGDQTTFASGSDEQSLDGQMIAALSGTLVLRYPERWPHSTQQHLLDLLKSVSSGGQPDRRRMPNSIIIIGNEDRRNKAGKRVEQRSPDNQLLPALDEHLSTVRIVVPPLRSRRQDILPLAQSMILATCKRHDRIELSLNPSSEATLIAADWPGNVTELSSTLVRAVLIAKGPTITPSDLGVGDDNKATRDLSLDEYFRYFVSRHQATLSETELAAGLGISRKALWERRQRMKLSREPEPGTIVDNSDNVRASD